LSKVDLEYLLGEIVHHLVPDKNIKGLLVFGVDSFTNRFIMIKNKVKAVDSRLKKIRELAERQGNQELLVLLDEKFDPSEEALNSKIIE
jgi:hypothetical protein